MNCIQRDDFEIYEFGETNGWNETPLRSGCAVVQVAADMIQNITRCDHFLVLIVGANLIIKMLNGKIWINWICWNVTFYQDLHI